METKNERVSNDRTWVILLIMAIAMIVTLGLCLSLVLKEDDNEQPQPQPQPLNDDCPEIPTISPLYNEPSSSIEGHYDYAVDDSYDSLCSKIGNMIMQLKGGNAVDAAIAVSLCNGVKNPHSSGIGGGNFITYYNRTAKKMKTVIGRERAPLGATADMFTDGKMTSSQTGGMSIAVPGEILGMYELWKLGGRLDWHALFKPSFNVLHQGFLVGKSLKNAIDAANKQKHFDEVPTFREFITNPKTGKVYELGERMFRPLLERTYTIISDEPFALYNGSLAENMTLDIADAGGIITMDDLANYTARVKHSLTVTLHNNMTVHSPPVPSGGLVYEYMLNILNGYKMDRTSVTTVDEALKTYHRITEAFKHAFSLRAELGDCEYGAEEFHAFIHETAMNMTNSSYGELARALIDDRKTFSPAYYTPKYANVWDREGAHVSVVGADGDAVVITSALNMNFGSKVIGKRTGIVFNNHMDDFTKPGTVNSRGMAASTANYIAPRKRPMSSMSPTIVVDGHGDVKLVIGASGGPNIATSSALVTMGTLLFNWGIKEAIDYPRIHHQLDPEELQVEKGFPQVLIDGLIRLGHNAVVYPTSSSAVHGIQRKWSQLTANCDYRKHGAHHGF